MTLARQVEEAEFKLMLLLAEKAEKASPLKNLKQTLKIYDRSRKRVIIFFWRGQESLIFTAAAQLESRNFFTLDSLPEEQERIMKVRRDTLDSYVFKKHQCCTECKSPYILSCPASKLAEVMAEYKNEDLLSLNFYSSKAFKKEDLEELAAFISLPSRKVFLGGRPDPRDLEFLPQEGVCVEFNLLARGRDYYDFFKSKSPVIIELLAGKSWFLFCQSSSGLVAFLRKNFELELSEESEGSLALDLSKDDEDKRYKVIRNLAKWLASGLEKPSPKDNLSTLGMTASSCKTSQKTGKRRKVSEQAESQSDKESEKDEDSEGEFLGFYSFIFPLRIVLRIEKSDKSTVKKKASGPKSQNSPGLKEEAPSGLLIFALKPSR